MLDELRIPPGNHLEALTGGRNGQNQRAIQDLFLLDQRWVIGSADRQLPSVIVRVPKDQLAISIDMDVPRRVISLAPEENKPTAPHLAHSKIVTCTVTPVNRNRRSGKLS